MQRLRDNVIIVAGVTSGIGEASAVRLAQEGARLVIAGRTLDACERVAENIRKAGGTAVALHYDQGDEELIARLIARSVETYGRLDGLLCNAAELRKEIVQRDLDVTHMEVEIWERLFRINVTGYALLMREAIPQMLRHGGGAIVLMSSDIAKMGMAQRHCYAATKAGVEALVRQVAERWGKEGIRCNAISPGMVMTEKAAKDAPQTFIDDMKARLHSPRLGKPEDIAAAVAFMLSEDAEWVQGQVLSVNGGLIYRG